MLPRTEDEYAAETADAAPPFAAVVPAAGRSSRFGSDKRQALIDGTPMLVRVVSLLKRAGAVDVIVIEPHDNPDVDRGMFSSIHIGLARALAARRDAAIDVVLVHPADMPFVRVDTIAHIAHVCRRETRAVCPRFAIDDGAQRVAKRGHPLALPREIAARLLTVDPRTPLNDALGQVGVVRLEIDVDDPGVLRDVDIPEDLVDRN